MRKKLATFGFGLCCLLAAGPALAQELDPETSETSVPVSPLLPEETPHPADVGVPDGKAFFSTPTRDDMGVRSGPAVFPGGALRPRLEKPVEKEEDALSFNFLFYIIQKFKISEVKNN